MSLKAAFAQPTGLHLTVVPNRLHAATSSQRPLKMSAKPEQDPPIQFPSFSTLCETLATPTKVTAAMLLAAAAVTTTPFLPPQQPTEAAAVSMKLPPIDQSDVDRCKPKSSAIGQANAARDKLLDLRECDLRKANLQSFDLSGALLSGANLTYANLSDAQLSKSYAPNANFSGTDFTNAVVDRVTFDGSNLTDAVFANAVLSDSTFDGANLENVDFTDVYIGDFAQRNICRNPTTKGTNSLTGVPTRESLGCR